MAEPSRRFREIETREGYKPELAIAQFLALLGLRGFWPMSAFSGVANAHDQSGNGRVLTYNGNPVYNYDGLIPYIRFDGTGDYLSRADEGGLRILGTETYVGVPGLTLGGWFYPESGAARQDLIAKWSNAAGQRSYTLFLDGGAANDPITFRISDDGTNADSAVSARTTTLNEWLFAAGRFDDADAGAELAVWSNEIQTTAATVRNAIFNSNSALNIGGMGGGFNLYTGRGSMCFLCAAALSDNIINALFQQTRSMFGI